LRRHGGLYLALIVMGAVWGAVFPITKVAVSTGHQAYGIIVWQSVIGIFLSGGITLWRGKKLPFSIEHMWLFAGIAFFGSLAPNYFSYTATAHLPAGIISIVIALVPLFSMPISLVMGYEKPSIIRFTGAAFGAVAIVLIAGPSASLPDTSKVGYLFLALFAPLFYGAEGNFMTWYGPRGLDPVQILFGASVVGLAVSVPIALGFGQIITPFQPWGAAEWAIFIAAVLNWGAYVGFVWLIGRAGPVFSSQVAYLITAWGVVWSMLFLGERYSIWVWMAFVLMLVGVLLVQPRETSKE